MIPGGESTTMAKLARAYDLVEPVRARPPRGMPIFGTCAGMIVLAERVEGGDPCSRLMDIGVQRNAYGRQVDSFEDQVDVQGIDHAVRGVFIRAPKIKDVGADVRVLASHEGDPVVLEQGNLLVSSFHPELIGETGSAPTTCSRSEGEPCPGHSKWATIKRKKEATDAKRSNMYAKLLRAVEVAAQRGRRQRRRQHDARQRRREGEELQRPERQHRSRDQAGYR